MENIYLNMYMYVFIYIRLVKNSNGFFHKMLLKNLNKLFGQPNINTSIYIYLSINTYIFMCIHICIHNFLRISSLKSIFVRCFFFFCPNLDPVSIHSKTLESKNCLG